MRVLFYKSIFLFALLFFFSKTFSQLVLPKMAEVTPAAPNTAALGKFGTYPVTLNTGLIDISVPVCQIKTPKLSVPISLSYHPSGIKVNDVSTWAGLGWSIISAGSITRSIMGNADEIYEGYLSTSGTQEIKDVGQTSFDRNLITIQDYLEKIETGYIDPEPDIFAYNFLGSSGRFIYNKDKTSFIRIPFDKSKVTVDFTNGFITITEKDGTFYRFGKALDGTDYKEYTSILYANGQPGSAPVNWPLTTVISADKKDTIQFKYTSSTGTFITDRIERFIVYSEHEGYQTLLPTAGTNTSTYQDLNNGYTGQLPSEIIFKNGKVVFETIQDRTDISGEKRLSTIKIYNIDLSNDTYVLQKTVQFYQSYFDAERMRLDSVGFTAPGATQAQIYRFGYNSTSLPARLNKAQDWWGYYNDYANSTLIPPISIPEGTGYLTYNTSVNREPNFTYARARLTEVL
ncbi:MAG TPA: hypothetical protein VI461_13340 [Chitinophagaceae bacterium]|nr:hypothetical protein [Chitinophagaceae bacterium]